MSVLGAGLMGAGIAQVSAQKGFDVVLKDKDLKGLTRGEQQIANNLVSHHAAGSWWCVGAGL